MRVPGALAAALALASSSIEAFAGEERFRSPLTIPDVPHPASIQAGDFNKDGKLDLVTANGSELLLVLLQGRSDRQSWKTVPVSVGVSCYFALAGDFDGDGADDLMAADNGSTAYFIRSNGDGTFAPPAAIPQSRGPRWIVAGDWNKDGRLDFASTNITTGTLTVFVGDASDGFRLTQNLPASEQHVVELLDYDGDGAQDLALSGGGGGFLLLKGLGDGTFNARAAPITPLGCVDYIQAADLNKDGNCDIATSCAATGGFSAAGISKGDGTFEKTWSDSPSGVLEPLAIGDLDADGNRDLVVANVKRTFFGVYLRKGDGALSSPPILLGPTGDAPEFLLARDLDDDGRQDIVSADNESSTLSVFWGREGSPFLEGGYAVSGYGSSKGFTVADLDRDGKLDFFFASSERAEILVYLRPGDGDLAEKSFSIQTAFKYTGINTADLNEDGIPDLIGIDRVNGKALVSLLSADGKAHDELSLDAGLLPSAIARG